MAQTTTASSLNRTAAPPVVIAPASADDGGKLVLRVVIGALILLHGYAKLKGGIGGIVGAVEKAGLPGIVAYGVYVGEVLAPLLLIIGLFTRAAALIVVVNMLFALGLMHMSQIFSIGSTGGWAIELQALYLFGSVAVMLLGAGRYSVGGIGGRWN